MSEISTKPSEETIARVISPLDWNIHDTTEAGSELRDAFPISPSLKKARAILALFERNDIEWFELNQRQAKALTDEISRRLVLEKRLEEFSATPKSNPRGQ